MGRALISFHAAASWAAHCDRSHIYHPSIMHGAEGKWDLGCLTESDVLLEGLWKAHLQGHEHGQPTESVTALCAHFGSLCDHWHSLKHFSVCVCVCVYLICMGTQGLERLSTVRFVKICSSTLLLTSLKSTKIVGPPKKKHFNWLHTN